ncbi:MAG: hypothetical protein WDO71_02215 [Bacteroidota bacterium]
MKKIFLFFFIVSVALYAKAQLDYNSYRRGYYISNKGDTMVGYIRYLRGNRARIEYFATGDKKAVKIYPGNCPEFVLNDTIKYIRIDGGFSVKVGIGVINVFDDFIEVLETGKVNLYVHHGISGAANFGGTVDWDNLVVRKDSSVYIGLHPNLDKRRREIEKQLKGEDKLIEIFCREKVSEIRKGIKEYNSK